MVSIRQSKRGTCSVVKGHETEPAVKTHQTLNILLHAVQISMMNACAKNTLDNTRAIKVQSILLFEYLVNKTKQHNSYQ